MSRISFRQWLTDGVKSIPEKIKPLNDPDTWFLIALVGLPLSFIGMPILSVLLFPYGLISIPLITLFELYAWYRGEDPQSSSGKQSGEK